MVPLHRIRSTRAVRGIFSISNQQSAIPNLALLLAVICSPLFADDLSPEQCATLLQKSTLTVRIRLQPEAVKEPEEEGPSAQVTVCSGVAVAEKLVVTAAFAAADSQIRVTLPGGEQTDARLRVLDEFSGLALLEAADARFTPLPFSSQPPVAGGWVMSAAAWGAEQPLVSVGIVGGVDRAIKGYVYPPLLQCDLRPAETSSGAAIVDRRGELLGVIVAGDRPEQRGWLYAVPASHVQRLLRAKSEKAKEDSVVVLKRRRPTCGLDLEATDAGILVSKVEPGGAAARAGMKVGDRILTADGTKVRFVYEAKRSTLYKQPGDTMTFEVQRADERKKFELVLGGGVELPSATLSDLRELVAPKIEITAPAKGKGVPTIREPYGAPMNDPSGQLLAEKMKILEKLNEQYKAKIEQQQKDLARRDEDLKLQAETLEAIKAELEAVKREKR
jgi:S1-C subfamily serine protease